jgi:NTE family protein
MRVDAVFEGGGVKGIGLVGAIYYAETEKNVEWMNVAGTSAGAMVASLIAARYRAAEIKDIMFNELDFNKIQDEGSLDRIPIIGKPMSVFFENGIYEGKYIEDFIARKLAEKNVYTFKDLVIEDETNPRYRYKLNVIASDISRGKLLVLPHDIKDYGIEPDDFSVAEAVRMSMSIPLIFEPVIKSTKHLRDMPEQCYIVDGGMLSNYPVWLFDSASKDISWPTVGFRLVGPQDGKPREINNPLDFLTAILATLLGAHDERHIQDLNFKRTVPIKTLGVGTTEFDITPERKNMLFESGVEAAKSFFASFSEEEYASLHPSFERSKKTKERLS